MNGFAQLLLVLTSLAPIGLVQAAVHAGRGHWLTAALFGGASLVLACLCGALLWGGRRWNSVVKMEAVSLSPKETEPLAFLVAYALPLVAEPRPGSIPGLIAFGLLMGLVVWQQQVFHVNPLLAALGFHFFSARNNSGGQVLLIARTKTLTEGVLSVVQLSDYLWLHCGNLPSGGARGSTGSDAARRITPAPEA